jgi:hypothetical protein
LGVGWGRGSERWPRPEQVEREALTSPAGRGREGCRCAAIAGADAVLRHGGAVVDDEQERASPGVRWLDGIARGAWLIWASMRRGHPDARWRRCGRTQHHQQVRPVSATSSGSATARSARAVLNRFSSIVYDPQMDGWAEAATLYAPGRSTETCSPCSDLVLGLHFGVVEHSFKFMFEIRDAKLESTQKTYDTYLLHHFLSFCSVTGLGTIPFYQR